MNKIKELREQRGITQSQLGQILNVSKSTISKYENGSLDLSSAAIAILCDYFRVSANQLLGISDNPISSQTLIIKTPPHSATATAPPTNQTLASIPTDPTLQAILRLAAELTPTQRRKALKLLELFSEEISEPTPAR